MRCPRGPGQRARAAHELGQLLLPRNSDQLSRRLQLLEKDDERNARSDLPVRPVRRLYGVVPDRTRAQTVQTQVAASKAAATKSQHTEVHYRVHERSRCPRAAKQNDVL